ncbi:MAG: putative toxin-antitoxin system toxin component, PIN family [Solirubrobacteraceae bacterium]
MTRLVIDASVLLSAAVAAPDTPLALLMGAVRSGAVEMVVCERLLGEVRRGLDSRYFRGRLSDEERKDIPPVLARASLMLPDPVSPAPVLRDPDDDYLLALASTTEAAAIVSGDGDLLEHPDLDPPAITAREACVRFGLIAR